MAQTTGGMSITDGDIEVAAQGTGVWVNISGSANSVDAPEQARTVAEDYTLDGDTAIITTGKREPMDIVVTALYTESSTETWETMRPWFQTGSRVDLRWSPQGIGAATRNVFTALNVPITKLTYPGLTASEANPARCSFTVRAPFVAQTDTASSTGLGS